MARYFRTAARGCKRKIWGRGLTSGGGRRNWFAVSKVTLKAHFDGEHIQLDEPYLLPRDAQLMVTVLTVEEAAADREAWFNVVREGLARAYGDNEPEYTEADVKA